MTRCLSRSLLLVSILGTAAGCADAPNVAAPKAPSVSKAAVAPAPVAAKPELDEMKRGAPREELTWAQFTPETLAKAKAERKYIVLDGSAEWCHWCHVMEAETYHDASVRKILDARFIAVKVDVDERPDIQERYGDWGWPATIIFSPDAEELGKFRGYIEPDRFAGILNDVVASGVAEKGAAPKAVAKAKASKTPLTEDHLAWIEKQVDLELDEYWDDDEGGWGRQQKAPLGMNNSWTLAKAARGDEAAKKKALFALDQQSKLLDPVWGGIYQYSAARDWESPHFEKLMTFQAPALDNYARAYQLTKDEKQLARAKAMQGYLDRFMKGPEGGFYTTQDADLNAHDRSKAFLDGHVYYAKDEKGRLAAGIPRVDTHEYGKENGLAIAAYATMYEVTKDPAVLASAEKAAKRILATHSLPGKGGITHDAVDPEKPARQLFLSDNAAFGFALVRLYEVTKNDEYLKRARAIADFIVADLTDDDGGGLFGATADPGAVGVFATRRVPFEDDVMALRFFGHLARATGKKDATKYEVAIDRTLRAVMTPEQIKSRGRFLGDVCEALEDTKGVRGVSK
jgi:uncharacterized protein YyaL (SSP411 family)